MSRDDVGHLAARLQPTVGRRLGQPNPHHLQHLGGQKARLEAVAPPPVGQGVEPGCFVALQQLLDPAGAEAGDLRRRPDRAALRQTVSDNLRSGVTRACFHEPLVNRTYADLARHYGTAIIPARPYKPRDKAKVEVGVQIVGRWVLARLRHRRFFSLAALNAAIRDLLADLNARTMRGWGQSRRALFEELERPALVPLPDEPFAYAEWKRCRVGLDYHVEIGRHHYSVPSALVRQEVEARVTDATVEIFLRGKRVASHLRSTAPGRATTVSDHMPSSHRRHREWTHDKIRREAARMGADAATLIDAILEGRPHPEQGFRSAIGIIGLARRHGPERVDAACARAIALGTRSYGSVARILSNRAEALTPSPAEAPVLVHANIRGPGYYH